MQNVRDPSTALAVLRIARGWTQAKLAHTAGLRPATVSDWERGKKTPAPRTLERLVGLMGYSPSMIQRAFAFLEEAKEATGPRAAEDLAQHIEALATGFGREVADFVRAGLTRLTAQASAIQERCRASFLWERLGRYGPAERRAVVQESWEFRNWALCELLCDECVKAAADSPHRALELAELALHIAKLVPGDTLWTSELQSYVWAFVGNARRVQGDLPGADQAFARSNELWPVGSLGRTELLDESRRLDLEASLRRDQRRLIESLELLDRALALGRGEAAGRILIKKGKTLEEMGDYEAAVATLRRAAPLVDGDKDPRLLLCLRFNLLVNLCFLGRHGEAALLVKEVRALTQRLGNDLDEVRLRWLEGRIASGLGQPEEAMKALRQVRAEFATRGIAYDTALVTLELAVLLAERGRTGEVKDLARHTAPLFQAQGVHREALAALALFRKAAEEETLTADLAREILEFLQKAQKDPEIRFALRFPQEEGREGTRPSRPG